MPLALAFTALYQRLGHRTLQVLKRRPAIEVETYSEVDGADGRGGNGSINDGGGNDGRAGCSLGRGRHLIEGPWPEPVDG